MATATGVATVDQFESNNATQLMPLANANPLANYWLLLLTICLGGTVLCTATLVAWPLLTKLLI